MRQQTKHMVRVFWTGDATGGYEFDDEDSAWYQVRDRITDTFNVGRLSDAINYEDVTVRGVAQATPGILTGARCRSRTMESRSLALTLVSRFHPSPPARSG